MMLFITQRATARVLSHLSSSRRNQRAQAITEYVLLLLGVATIALAVTAWAARTGKISDLMNRVFDALATRVS